MRPLPRRMPSKSAKWALRVSVFAPILAVMSTISHRSSSIDTPTFFVLLVVIALVAATGLTLTIMAFRSLWVHGKRGGRRASWALLFCAIVLFPFVVGAIQWIVAPQVTEVSTDLIDPPVSRDELLELANRAPTIVAGTLQDAYPQIVGRRYNTATEAVYERALELGEERGWAMINRRGRIGADTDLIAQYATASKLLGLPGEVIIRVRDEGSTAYLDVRSRSIHGAHDLGLNARLISNFIADMDFALIGQSN